MPLIALETRIEAPIERCFDLSRSIDLHKVSTAHTNEEATAGTISGLIGLGETVAWRAKHFGIYQKLTSKITEFDSPRIFVDEMIQGAFKRIRHEHHFETTNDGTLMTDVFDYELPLGVLGKLVDFIILKKYMTELLVKRNQTIKQFAETDQWKEVLNS